MQNLKLEKRNIFTLALFMIYLLALTWLILFKLQFSVPVMAQGRVISLIPFGGSLGNNGGFLSAEIRNNILVFIPWGIYICMLKSKCTLMHKILATAVITLAFEITQFVFAIGIADITDVLSNTLGGIIGIGIYALLFKLLNGKTNKVINILAAISTVLTVSFIAFVLINNRWVLIQ